VDSCESGWEDCDEAEGNGCETETAVDLENCGGCDIACPERVNAARTCAVGLCGYACSTGYLDCDGGAADGCEVDPAMDVANCGGCGVGCTMPAHGTAGCASGSCGIGVCDTGWTDCNVAATDGCEVDTHGDPWNCGGCGTACTVPAHGTAGCASGSCGIGVCDTGWMDCNAVVGDGCEINTAADPSNCGTCGSTCASGICTASICAAPTCTDLVRNGSETDVDCGGGTCPLCADGRMCILGSRDCASGVCIGGICRAPSCVPPDGVRNGTETDVDCGGTSCPRCDTDKRCILARDCISGVCTGGLCRAPTCADAVQNGTETDMDCGGACAPAKRCAVGQGCRVNGDCTSAHCVSNICQP
jgi:hypothetical protein